MTAASSNKELEMSISFGKFENDLLSWEKFSAFSPNKYLEEVEKCATPGSVAQKKAYFESHYKKIAERKAEIILEHDQQLERNASFRPCVEHLENTDNSENSQEDEIVTGIANEVNVTCIYDEPLEETMNIEECQSSVDATDDLNNTLKLEKLEEIVCMEKEPELIVQVEDKEELEEVVSIEEEEPELIVQVEDKEEPEDVVSIEEEVKEDIPSKDTGEMIETPMKETKKEKYKVIKKTYNLARDSPKSNQVNKKPLASKIVTSKKTQPSKEKSMIKGTNKAASPVTKAPGFSTPRVSKQASTISSMSTSSSSVKKENVSSLPEKKQTAPKTLHTSLNLDQPGSDPTALTTRRSLIMEQMGDKDIVRRVFKTFQKSFDQLKPSGDGQDSAPKQVPAKATSVSKLATTGQKENGRLVKSDGMEKKGANSHRSSSFAPKSNGTAEKQQLSRPGARAVDRIRLQAKPKAEATNRGQSLDPKAKSMQGPLPKGSSEKIV